MSGPAGELEAALHGAVVVDGSSFGRVRATGKDILDLLHRLTTADLRDLAAGEGRPAVITTPKGRIVERIFVHHLDEGGVMLVTGPGAGQKVKSHVERHTFREETGLEDVSARLAHLIVLGSRARQIAETAGVPVPRSFGSTRWSVLGAPVDVLGQDAFTGEGLSFLVPVELAPEVRRSITEALEVAGARPAGAVAVEAWRVLRGLPGSGHELTEEHNPLEAGLSDSISFTKGCYVGQEVVARLRTYDKVSRVLVGLTFPAAAPAPAPGSTLHAANREVGAVTSALVPPGWSTAVGLAYVRRDFSAAGTDLRLGTEEHAFTARVTDLPFAAETTE